MSGCGRSVCGDRRRRPITGIFSSWFEIMACGRRVSIWVCNFPSRPRAPRRLTLRPGAEEQATFTYAAKSGGFLEARLNVRDAFPQDDRAVVELPPQASSHVVIYSNEPQLLRPLFAANPQVEAVFESPDKFDPAVKADVVVLDRFIPPSAPRVASIWIDPPSAGSPVPVRATKTGIRLDQWHPETTLGAGIRTRDVTLESAEVFSPAAGDITIAETSEGPVVVAARFEPQAGGHRIPSRPRIDEIPTGDAAADRQHSALDDAGSVPPLGVSGGNRRYGQCTRGKEHEAGKHPRVGCTGPFPALHTSTVTTCDFFPELREPCACRWATARWCIRSRCRMSVKWPGGFPPASTQAFRAPLLGDAAPRESVALAGAAGRNRAAGRLAAVRAQPGVPLASLACHGSAHPVEKSVMIMHGRCL